MPCLAGNNVRLLHLVMNCRPSFMNSRGISNSSFAWSIFAICFGLVCVGSGIGRAYEMSALEFMAWICVVTCRNVKAVLKVWRNVRRLGGEASEAH